MPDRSGPGSPTTALSTGELQGGSDKLATGAKPTFKMASGKVNIGTWNVRTLYACGKVNELEHELKRYQWDILGLVEMRWTGFGETTSEDGHKIWYSGEETQHERGVGFIVRREITGYILSCTPVSSRIISIRVSARPKNVTIIQVYAPTTDHEDHEIEEFYEQVESVIKKTPKKDLIIIQGDFNAKIGEDATRTGQALSVGTEQERPTTGDFACWSLRVAIGSPLPTPSTRTRSHDGQPGTHQTEWFTTKLTTF